MAINRGAGGSGVAAAAVLPADGTFIVGNGTTWVGETGVTARTSIGFPQTATGDIWYASSATAITNLGIGGEGQYLSVSSGVPAWATLSTDLVNDTTPQLGGDLDMNGFAIQASDAAGPTIVDEAASANNPTLIPNIADLTTGIGSNNNLVAISNGQTVAEFADNGTDVNYWRFTGSPTTLACSCDVNGTDTNITMQFVAKGTGDIEFHDGTGRHFYMDGDTFQGNLAAAGAILNETASNTNPTVNPHKGDPDTGLGWVSANNWSLISGGTETVRMSAADVALKQVSGTFQGDNAAGPAIINEASSSLNPTLLPHKVDVDTGIGGDGANELFVVAGGAEIAGFNGSGLILGNTGARVTQILDEDTMASDSATSLATQQSIKAYVDAATGGGGGAYTFQSAQTASTSSQLDFALDDTTKKAFLFVFRAVRPTTDNRGLQMRVSTDSGATFDAGADYGWHWKTSQGSAGTWTSAQSTAAGRIDIVGTVASSSIGNTTAQEDGLWGWLQLWPDVTDTAGYMRCQWHVTYKNTDYFTTVGMAQRIAAQDTTDVRFLMSSSDTIASGTIYMYSMEIA